MTQNQFLEENRINLRMSCTNDSVDNASDKMISKDFNTANISKSRNVGFKKNILSAAANKTAKGQRTKSRQNPNPRTCLFCAKVLYSNQSLTGHINAHIGEQECQDCGQTFSDSHLRSRHQNLVHNGLGMSTRKFSSHLCLFCDKMLYSQQTMEMHTNGHTGERPYECVNVNCEESFPHHIARLRHMREVHKIPKKLESQEDIIDIDISNVTLEVKQEVDQFAKVKKLVEEEIIEKGTPKAKNTSKGKLKSNRSGIKPKENAKIKPKPQKPLRYHVVIENSKKQFKCRSCSKLFSMLANLLRHQRIAHSSKLLYKCNFCGIKFISHNVLWVHKKASHADQLQLFECLKCDKMFTNRRNLRRHRKSAHLKEEAATPMRNQTEDEPEEDFLKKNMESQSRVAMGLKEIFQWQKRMQKEYKDENQMYQKKLSSFIWNMNKSDI